MGEAKTNLEELKKTFEKELEGIDDIKALRAVYAEELAKRDKLILELQDKNEILLKTAFKNKDEDIVLEKKSA